MASLRFIYSARARTQGETPALGSFVFLFSAHVSSLYGIGRTVSSNGWLSVALGEPPPARSNATAMTSK